jgi:hypothetical protein
MTKRERELLDRIESLERRVLDLEARPPAILPPVFVPVAVPHDPQYSPWHWPQTVC